ncbi:hypothetical protein HK101_010976 [Irineochytrium annulatum]|nr:hypothetical protein HK101_010976 [Irineochytrium annulatum]
MIVAGVLRAGPPWRLVVPRSVQRPAVGVRHHSFLPRFVTAASPIVSTRRRPRPTPIAVLVRGHSHGHGPAGDAGHGHSHAHGADLIDRSSAEGTRITIIGLASNVALTVGKGAGGILWGSASLLADAVHSLLDLVSDFVTLFTFRKARADRDERFPYGYGKLEPLGALSISGILLFGGLGTGYHSFELLRALILSNDGPSASGLEHSAMLVDPHLSMLALAAIVGSIVVKEVLFWTTMAVAKKTKSDVLVANAWHHRADSVTSLVALCGIGGAVAGFPFLDPIGGILVSGILRGMIVQASLQVLLPSIRELSDSAPKDTLDRVKEIVAAMQDHDKNILGFNTVRGRKMGPDYLVDLQLQVSPRITVSQSHQIAENVRHAITTKISGISEVLIHVDVEEHDHHVEDAVATKKPTSEIEEEIIRHAMYGLEHEVHEVSHLSVHFLNGGMEVTAEIILERENEISLRDASAIAHKIEDRILQFPGVLSADVHLETTEDMREVKS